MFLLESLLFFESGLGFFSVFFFFSDPFLLGQFQFLLVDSLSFSLSLLLCLSCLSIRFFFSNFLLDRQLSSLLVFFLLFSSLSHDCVPLSSELSLLLSLLPGNFSESLCFLLGLLHSSELGIFSIDLILLLLGNPGLLSLLNSYLSLLCLLLSDGCSLLLLLDGELSGLCILLSFKSFLFSNLLKHNHLEHLVRLGLR